jgi:hypothetical protein
VTVGNCPGQAIRANMIRPPLNPTASPRGHFAPLTYTPIFVGDLLLFSFKRTVRFITGPTGVGG